MELGWEKVPNWESLFVHRKQGLFLSENVDDIRMAGKKQKKAPMWKKLMEHVDLDEPTSFLDHVYLGCTQRECKPNEIIIDEYRKKCSNPEFLLKQLKNYQGGRNLTQRRLRGPMIWRDMLKHAMRDIANWRPKRQGNYTK